MNTKIAWAEMEVGGTYFLLGYYDPSRNLPYIETLKYRGFDSNAATDQKEHTFEYAVSWVERAGVGSPSEENTITFLDSDPSCLGDLDGLIRELERHRRELGDRRK